MTYNADVDLFQESEYPMLQGKTYLDHGGATVYAKSLIETVAKDLIANLYGNPHSASDPAMLSGHMVDSTREKTLRFFGADPEHFDLIFVANATAAIKLVMESFKDLGNASRTEDGREGGFRYYYHVDSHNSIIGVRETTDNNYHCFRSDEEVEDWLDGRESSLSLNDDRLGLFAYPGQSNMTGRRLPLSWPGRLRDSSHESHQETYTLFDAAALATTAPLNDVFANPETAPDFTALSFYKIFGYPDLGGLIVRKSSGSILRWGRKYFGGGTVEVVVVLGSKPWYQGRKSLHESLEDGTLPFHSIIALNAAIDTHERLYGPEPMKRISKHATFLGKRLYDAMSSLVYPNGMPVCKIYNIDPELQYGNPALQGATIAFNIYTPQGIYIPYTSVVESLANKKKIFVRAGTLCNPGGIATYLGFDPFRIKNMYENGHKCSNAVETGTEVLKGRPTGVVRVSLGAMTTMENVNTFVAFLQEQFMSGNVGTYSAEMYSHSMSTLNPESVPRPRDERSFRDRSRGPPSNSHDHYLNANRSQPQFQNPYPSQSHSRSHSRNNSSTYLPPSYPSTNDSYTHSRPPTQPSTSTSSHSRRSPSVDTTATSISNYEFSRLPTPNPRRVNIPMPTPQQTESVRQDFESILSFSGLEQEDYQEIDGGREKRGLRSLWKGRGRKGSVSVAGN